MIEVGKRYEVSCVRARWIVGETWWPVIGGLHSDPELDFVPDHWHVDIRFLGRRYWEAIRKTLVEENGPGHDEQDIIRTIAAMPIMLRRVVPLGKRHTMGNEEMTYYSHADIQEQNRRIRARLYDKYPRSSYVMLKHMYCKRDMLLCERHTVLRTKLYSKFRGACLNPANPICPHKGFDLRGIKPVDGVITCPLHGLRFSSRTGEALFTEEEANEARARFENKLRLGLPLDS